MKLRDFLIGVATGLAAAIIIKETSERISPFVPANQVLNNVKSEFKRESSIDGSWIYMKTEDFYNGITTIPVYKGGISRVHDGELESFEFAADARTGVIVDLKKI
ncbi:peptidase M4 [Ureibacillus manganicus]|uniref:Peptidase M4 n=1 Tax=Ureibacillus manganicus DSM 26584 TaxID=1384049 RepID=A0A0A3HMH4_9BACL|nr:peptidase M4 [Ureibacillus manganicus]KGR73584.1 peptidase M4 [Ureibacillus manganicus DSM 26584]